MENRKFNIEGLNLKADDREAPAGACRVLDNLYPSGNPQSPIWKPISNITALLTHSTTIVAANIWSHSNQGEYLIFIDTDGKLYHAKITSGTPGSVTQLYTYGYSNKERKASFTQIGDTLIVCTTIGGESEEILMISYLEGAIVIYPMVIPALPRVRVSDYIYTDADKKYAYTIYSDMAYNGAANQNIYPEYLIYFGGSYVSYKYAWELIDGSIVGCSPLLVFKSIISCKPSVMENSGNRLFDVSVAPKATINYIIKADRINIPLNFKKIIRGIAVFMSPAVMPDEYTAMEGKLFPDSLYYLVGIIRTKGNDIGNKKGNDPGISNDTDISITEMSDTDIATLQYHYRNEDHLMKRLYDEDTLIHPAIAKSVSSYNKSLILLQSGYDFLKPMKIDGSPSL